MKPRFLSLAASSFAFALFALPARASNILIDFGSSATRTESKDNHWNNVDEQTQGALEGLALLDTRSQPTGVLLDITSPFASPNPNGAKEPAVAYPASATGDSLFANIERFNNHENVRPVLVLRGLKPARKYTLTFFASRMGSSDNRTTRYTVEAATTEAVELDAANNTDNTAKTKPLAPRADGSLTITLTPGAANNNANHFMYLGILEIAAAD